MCSFDRSFSYPSINEGHLSRLPNFMKQNVLQTEHPEQQQLISNATTPLLLILGGRVKSKAHDGDILAFGLIV